MSGYEQSVSSVCATAGFSVGEFAALVFAKSISLEDGKVTNVIYGEFHLVIKVHDSEGGKWELELSVFGLGNGIS